MTWVLPIKCTFKRLLFKMSNVRRQVPCGVHFLVWNQELCLPRIHINRAVEEPGRTAATKLFNVANVCGTGDEKDKTVFH